MGNEKALNSLNIELHLQNITLLSVVVLGRQPSSSAGPHQVSQACCDNNNGAILSQLQVPKSSKMNLKLLQR